MTLACWLKWILQWGQGLTHRPLESQETQGLSLSAIVTVSRHGFFSDPHVHHHHNGWIEVGIVLINTKFLWWDYYYWRSTLGESMTLMLQLAFPSNSFHIDSLINFNDSTFTHFKLFTFTQVETTFTLIKSIYSTFLMC